MKKKHIKNHSKHLWTSLSPEKKFYPSDRESAVVNDDSVISDIVDSVV